MPRTAGGVRDLVSSRYPTVHEARRSVTRTATITCASVCNRDCVNEQARSHATATPPPALLHAWEQAVHGWSNPAHHDTVLGVAAKHSQYAWLAARYREAALRQPHDPIPAQRLARLQRAALLTLSFEGRTVTESKTRSPFRGVAAVLVMTVLATVVGLWLVDSRMRDYQQRKHSTVTTRTVHGAR